MVSLSQIDIQNIKSAEPGVAINTLTRLRLWLEHQGISVSPADHHDGKTRDYDGGGLWEQQQLDMTKRAQQLSRLGHV